MVDIPKHGQQADNSFLRLELDNAQEIIIFRKKSKKDNPFPSVENEKNIGRAIKQHLKYPEVKSLLSLPIYDEKRASGNELIFHKKETDLESYRNYLQSCSFGKINYLFQQLCNVVHALCFLHNNIFYDDQHSLHYGIIRGDIKPDDILLDKKGNFLLADFGCAYFSTQPIAQLSMSAYLSPELLKEIKNYSIKILPYPDKNDIRSLGVTMKQLLTGEYPIQTSYDHKSLLQMDQHTAQGYVMRENFSFGKNDYLEKQGVAYLESHSIYQKNLSSKNIIHRLCKEKEKDPSSCLSSIEIFNHLIAMMLLPALDRPNAQELKEILNKLAVYFPKDNDLNIIFAKNMLKNVLKNEKTQNCNRHGLFTITNLPLEENIEKKVESCLDKAMHSVDSSINEVSESLYSFFYFKTDLDNLQKSFDSLKGNKPYLF